MEGERATPNCRSKGKLVAWTCPERNPFYREDMPEVCAEYGTNQKVFGHWETHFSGEWVYAGLCYIQNKLLWCDFNFNQDLQIFLLYVSQQNNIFIRLVNEKKERKSVFTKINHLNNSIQSTFCLKLFAKSWRNRPKSAKHATNQDNMTNWSLAEGEKQC